MRELKKCLSKRKTTYAKKITHNSSPKSTETTQKPVNPWLLALVRKEFEPIKEHRIVRIRIYRILKFSKF